MWQFLCGVFTNEEIMKDFLDETKQLWGIDFDNEDAYGFIRSLFNCALRCERCRINSETNRACGKVIQKQSAEHKRRGTGGEAWRGKRKKFVFK